MPIFLGLGLIIGANVLLFCSYLMLDPAKLQTGSLRGSQVESHAETVSSDDQNSTGSQKSKWQIFGSILTFVKGRKIMVVLLAGYWLRMLAVSVTKLQLLYVAKLFGWTYAKVRLTSLQSPTQCF